MKIELSKSTLSKDHLLLVYYQGDQNNPNYMGRESATMTKVIHLKPKTKK
jgi:hypothetical protein